MYNSIALQIFYLYSSASADLGPTLMNVKKTVSLKHSVRAIRS